MAKSNKPIIWGPFAAGGTVAAFIAPVLILLTLMAALGHVPDALAYARLHAFAAHWLGKLVLLVVIGLSLWTSAHRLRITAYDLGVRADALVAWIVYLAAGGLTVAAAVFLARIN